MDRYTMGNIELSDDEWAKLRQYTATADEIAKTPTTFDERNVPGCGYTTCNLPVPSTVFVNEFLWQLRSRGSSAVSV